MGFKMTSKTKMRILYYTGSLASGGTERQLTYTSIAAKDRGYEVIIAVDYPTNQYESMFEVEGLRVYCINKTKISPQDPIREMKTEPITHIP